MIDPRLLDCSSRQEIESNFGRLLALVDGLTTRADALEVRVTGVDSLTILFDANGGTGVMVDTNSPYLQGSTFVFPACIFVPPEGFVFGGKWGIDVPDGNLTTVGNEYPVDTYSRGDTLTLYPYWVPAFELTFGANGGTGDMVDQASPYADGMHIILPECTFTPPVGKIFNCWNSTADGNGDAYDPGYEIIMIVDLLLYAIWSDVFTITYLANGGTGETVDPGNPYMVGTEVEIAECAFTPPTDKVFSEWNTAADGTGSATDPGVHFNISANRTYYAIWSDVFTITYLANGGTGETVDPASPYIDGAEATVMACLFTPPASKVFSEWSVEPAGEIGPWNSPGNAIEMHSNRTYYAIWVDA